MRVRMFDVLSLATLAVIFGVRPSAARADVIFTNFGSGQTYVGNNWWNLGSAPATPTAPAFPLQADAFSFSPTTTAVVTGADLALAGSNNPLSAISPVNVYIESNTASGPGTILDTLTQTGTYTTYPTTTVVNFTCSGTCTTLNAGSTYWIVALLSNGTDLSYWLYSFSDTGTWYFNNTNSATGPWTTATAGNNFSAFDVTGTAATPTVPEPTSLALLGSGLMGIVAVARRRAWRG